jgi:endonuclease YncB( thermonuclease family)
MKQQYIYNATLDKIIDGDTIDVIIDLGFSIFSKQRIRLARINAPEMKTEEGQKSKAFLVSILNPLSAITVSTNGKDKYGRYIAEVMFNNSLNLSDAMVSSNQAVPHKY